MLVAYLLFSGIGRFGPLRNLHTSSSSIWSQHLPPAAPCWCGVICELSRTRVIHALGRLANPYSPLLVQNLVSTVCVMRMALRHQASRTILEKSAAFGCSTYGCVRGAGSAIHVRRGESALWRGGRRAFRIDQSWHANVLGTTGRWFQTQVCVQRYRSTCSSKRRQKGEDIVYCSPRTAWKLRRES